MTIPDGYAEISLQYTGAGAPTGAVNTFGVALMDVADTPATVAEICRSAWAARIMPNLTDDVTLSGVHVKFGPDDTGPFVQIAAATAGGVATTSLTPNTAFLVTKATQLGGRRGRGRLYIPGVAESAANDSGVLIGSWPADVGGDLDAFLSDLEAADVPMVVLHSPATEWVLVNGQPRRVPIAGELPVPSEVTSLALSASVATQRRRLRR